MPYVSTEWKDAKYTILRISILSIWNNLQAAKHAVLNLGRICSVCFFTDTVIIDLNTQKFCFLYEFIGIFDCQWSMHEFIGVNFTVYFCQYLKLAD
jgi:hypothetical protein